MIDREAPNSRFLPVETSRAHSAVATSAFAQVLRAKLPTAESTDSNLHITYICL